MVRGKGTVFEVATSRAPDKHKPDPLPTLIQEAQGALCTASTVFPFVFFPDQVIVRLHHVDIVRKIFFSSSSTQRLQIHDIQEIFLHYNPLFATLEIVPKGIPDLTTAVKFLNKRQAVRAKRMIMGLVECHQNNVDFSRYSREELPNYIEEIGRVRSG